MMNNIFKVAAFAAVVVSGPLIAQADTFVLTNDNGGDGYAVSIPGGYDLFGSDNGAAGNTTALTATAGSTELLTYNYTYTSHDIDGAGFDPGGYFINGVNFQLSPPFSSQGDSNSGVVSLSLTSGDSYGFYVYTTDGVLGRGEIAFSSAVPEPAAWSVMLLGVGLMGGVLRRRRTAIAA